MTQSRQSQVSLSDTPYYHCISRCVRRAYLCGEDKYTGKSFEHRRQWVVERMHYLASLFNIDICAYAIMSNHYHLVLHIDEALNESLSHEEVCERWCLLYSKPILVERWQSEQTTSEAEKKAALAIIEGWRGRLADISWFMRCLNEFIARKANKEDECSGRFWEGRFKSQALLDEDALLTCMAYVDLNPVRAKMSVSIETSEYTSAYERIHGVAQQQEKPLEYTFTKKPLFGFVGDESQHNAENNIQGLPFSLLDYIELVDWSGRIIREDKRGAISNQRPRLLSMLALDDETWLSLASSFGKDYHGAVGSLEALAAYASNTGKRWIASKNQLRLH
ncbi:transposase [Psychromonas sp. 14N.309.X.WAT.B.A12]|uniref:transposase n=1 Tax=unclassified Psychromonas TaxID=2614957 RepID=UPI0025B19E33|nr:transposase [Psychromonas sp. 14N.309.X.WAT.B.A12]MDN2662110.1 transposase [Psychromonas sp. 14N.309.X.WAT.B.A12]